MIPELFLERMKKMLGEEYPAFYNALTEDAVKGARLNKLKICENATRFPFLKEALPYCDGGFILDSDCQIGRTPHHHAGMIYVQDPGAMATVGALEIGEDWWVADLCSAPGGKSSQALQYLTKGFLLANEYVPKRAKIIVSNLERLGASRAIVTSLDTGELAKMYEGVFDLVIADAPCSGEGMFRKSEEAIEDWSEENVLACAKRQEYILDNAAGMVKPDGYLLYSTCTYSMEENELTVLSFLKRHEEFSVAEVSPELIKVTRPGFANGAEGTGIERTRRFYPHVSRGEGQYVALLKKDGAQYKPKINYKDAAKEPRADEKRIALDFLRENLEHIPDGRIAKCGENLVFIQHGCPVPEHGVFMSGVCLGQIKGKLLIPHHQFFSAFGRLFKRRVELDEQMAQKYLLGEELPASSCEKGYCAVTFLGVPMGGGKISDGRLKNHYPKGLRNKQ